LKIKKQVFAQARKAAKRIRKKYGKKNLGWDDFEWGMVNGKLSALRWVMGDEWDFSTLELWRAFLERGERV